MGFFLVLGQERMVTLDLLPRAAIMPTIAVATLVVATLVRLRTAALGRRLFCPAAYNFDSTTTRGFIGQIVGSCNSEGACFSAAYQGNITLGIVDSCNSFEACFHAASSSDQSSAESLPEAVPVSEEEKCDEDGVTVDDENLEAGPDTRRPGQRKGRGSLIVRSSSRIKKFGLELLDMTAEKVGKKSRRHNNRHYERSSGDARRTKMSKRNSELSSRSTGSSIGANRSSDRSSRGEWSERQERAVFDHNDRRQQYSASHQLPLRRGESYSSHQSHNYHSRRSNAGGDSTSSHYSHRPPDSYRGSDTSYRGDSSHRHYQDSYRDHSRRREYDDYSRGGREYDDYSRGGRDYDDYGYRRGREHDDYGYRRGRGDASVISEIEIDHYADESRSVSYNHRPSRPPPTGSYRRYHGYQESDAGSISSSLHSAYMGGSSRQLHYRGGRDYNYRGPSGRPSSVSWDELGDPIQMALESSLRDLSCQVVGKQCIAKKRVLKPEEPILSDTDIGPWQCRDCAFVNGNGRHLTCAVCNAQR